jgi:hypothetical protein
MHASTTSSIPTRAVTMNASTSSIPTSRAVTMHASTSSIPTRAVTMHASPSSIPTRAIKSMNPYNEDPYILDPTKMDMIQNSDIEENRQEVVDLLSVSMHAMLMAAFKLKRKKLN